jgi:3-deoxy-D-manno-octulosonic acid kinase
VRHAWHGGLLAPITGDLFRRPTRAPLEVERSIELRALGIPTTDIVGYALYDAMFGLARVDVCTAYVDDTADLGMILAGLAPALECDGALEATLRLLERLAAHGVVHPDLNVKNILIRTPSTGVPEALVIDIDVVRLGATPADAMARNVARLERSLRKWKTHFGCDVADQRIREFVAEAMARTPQARA